MKHFTLIALVGATFLTAVGTFSEAQSEPSSTAATPAQTVKATFLITGLHCPPCTATVEKSLKSEKGVKNVKVEWATKNAKVEFDEQQIAAQQIASRIASTSHMMGGTMKYSGWLALKVPEITADGNAEKAKSALMKVKGVSAVSVYPQQKSVGVEFSAKGESTSVQLIEALKVAGLEATVFP